MKNFYSNKINELHKRKKKYGFALIGILIATTTFTIFMIYTLESRNKNNLTTLSEVMEKQQQNKNSSQLDMENLKYMISEMAANDRTVINEFLLVLTIVVSFTGAALINGYLETNKQIDELEEKQMLSTK